MALYLHVGPSGSGKTQGIHKLIFEEASKDFFHNYLLLVPEQYTLETQRTMIFESPVHGIMNIDVLSFMRLAYRVLEEKGKHEPTVLEDTGKSMIVKKVAMDLREELGIYRSKVGRQGFIDEMKSVIAEFYQYGVTPERIDELCELSKESVMLPEKLRDINLIYRGFRSFIEGRFIMNEEVLDILVREAKESKTICGAHIFFDGFTGFTVAQLDVISVLLRYAADVHVTLTMEPGELDRPLDEESLFGLGRKTAQKLTKLAGEARVPVIVQPYTENFRTGNVPELSELQKYIFRAHPGKKLSVGENGAIRIFSCSSPGAEIETVIEEIKKLVEEENYRYGEIAVVSGDMATYSRMAERAFGKAGIPCFVDNKKNIIGTSAVELVRACIETAASDFSFDSVFRYLKTGMGPLNREETAVLENYCLAKGIRHRKSWEREWNGAVKTRYVPDMEAINALRVRVYESLSEAVNRLICAEVTVAQRVEVLRKLLTDNAVSEKLTQLSDEQKLSDDEEMRLLGEENAQLYGCIEKVFERIELLLGEEKLSLKEFSQILDTGFREAKLGYTPRMSDAVLLGDIERSRIENVRALFFIGVNDGIIPKSNPGGSLLSDSDRTVLLQNDLELSPTRRQSAYLSEYYLYLNITKPHERLYIMYHRMGSDCKPTLPSYLIASVLKLYDGLKVKEVLGDKTKEKSFESVPEALTPETAQKLYSEVLTGSVTMLEKYANCAYAHFLKYGLRIEERPEYSIGAAELGTIYHAAIERYFRGMHEKGLTWQESPADSEERKKLEEESVLASVADYRELLEDSKRNAYTCERVKRILARTIKVLDEQIKAGSFEPAYVEQSFTHSNAFMRLTGKIDRMDVYESGGTKYLRVIDYKTGSSSFNLKKLYLGLQLQLAVYMKEGTRLLRERQGSREAEPVKPAGFYYYNIDDPILDVEKIKDEEVEAVLAERLKLKGPTNSDPVILEMSDAQIMDEERELKGNFRSRVVEVVTGKKEEPKKGKEPQPVRLVRGSRNLTTEQFELLNEFVDKKLSDEGKEISSGKIDAQPVREGSATACEYCKFGRVCGFCEELGGKYRDIQSVAKKEDELWSLIETELGREGTRSRSDD